MNGGKDCESGDERQVPVQVPIGWQRKPEQGGGVVYVSPSGSVLSSLEQVKTYLLTDGTCKCGLECPLILHKVFNFDPGAAVKQRTAEDVKADEDVTKLCIHKRKLLAVATLHRSMGTHPPLTLTSPGGGTSSVVTAHSTSQRAIRTKPHDGLSNAVGPDCKNPFKMMMAAGQQQQRLYPAQEMGGAQQPELYSGYSRPQRLGSGDPGPKSPYRVGYGGMLSPPSSAKLYGDGSQSPSAETLGSPDGFPRTNPCGFPGSPGSTSIHGNTRTPLSPPSVMLHGSPAGQPSCAMTGRTSTPLSPTATAKSPVMNMNMPRGNFPPGMDMPRAAFHHKTQPPVHPVPPPPSIPPSCALQKRQLTSEKDPLGILDPIPSKPASQPPTNAPNPANFQPNIHSQVQMMNVNIPPPAIVPLPSNLPLPTVKPGPVGHGGHVQRTQQGGPASSMSPSPVTSPVHMTGPVLGRMEASPHRSRSSSTSSDHGNFAMPSGHQAPCGNMKVPPRSPRSAMGSPRPAMPSSPSTNKTDPHHQMLPSMGNSIGTQQHSNPMYSPTSSSSSSSSLATPSASQKGHPGLLGMPLNQILNQQNAASFPASSLLSAAAKAQLANQNKLNAAGNSPASMAAGGSGGMGAGGGGNGGGGGHPGSMSGPRSMEGHSTLNSMLPPNSTMLLNTPEGQSGRAALRDKLMAQQRDPMRKRKQSSGSAAINHDNSNNMVYNMLNKRGMGGPHMAGPSATEQLRKVGRLGNLPPNTSMAQLLQSMSCQSSHNMAGNSHRPGLSPGAGPQGSAQLHYNDSTGMVPAGPQQNLLAQQRLRGPGDAMQHCQNMDTSGGHLGPRPGQFPDMISQMQASSMSNCGPMGPGGGPVGPDGMPLGRPHTNPPPLSHPGPHPSQQNLLHSMGRTNMVVMTHGGGDGSCTQTIADTGNSSSLGCGLGGLQQHVNAGGGQMYQQQVHQGLQQGVAPHLAYQGQQHFSDNTPYTDGNNANPGSMACLYQNYQPGMLSHPQFREEQQPQGEGLPPGAAGSERGPGGGPESVDAIYRAVVDAASKGMHVTITTTVSGTTQSSPVPALSAMSAFTASIGEPVNLPQAVSTVLHRHQDGEALPQQTRPRQVRAGRGQKNMDPGKSTPDGPEANDYFRSPGRGTPRGQWDGETQHGGFDAHSNNSAWGGEEFLECSTQVRSSPCMERPASLAPAPPCPTEGSNDHGLVMAHDKAFLDDAYRFNNSNRTPVNYKERLEQTVERCVHINGATPHFNTRGYGEVLGPPRQELTGDDQSPSSSTSLEGPLATAKDYSHYNGHFNGMAPSPSDTKSLSSEEDLRQPDSPSSELLHYRSRTFNMGELVWGQLKGFPPWPAKLAGEEQVHSAAMQLREQAKVEPEKLKTLTHDLEALDRAAKRGLKPGKLNNHLEAAIHEAMSELDKMSGTIPSRDRQVKLPKPKRRKISR